VSIDIELNIISIVDILTRCALLLISALVFVEFLPLRRVASACSPLLYAILAVVGTTAASVAYYLMITAAPRDVYLILLDWGFVVQLPRLWAMMYLLKIIRGQS